MSNSEKKGLTCEALTQKEAKIVKSCSHFFFFFIYSVAENKTDLQDSKFRILREII